jgi:HD-like signal output (HDOD) protein
MSITETELIIHLKKLPPLPAPLQQVLSFLNDPQSNWAKIGKVMLKDPVLTGRVLQIANSSFYGLHRQVKDIEIACSVLGAETLRGLVYTLILLSKFRHGQENSLIDYDLLWRNSLRVACLVKKIARQSKQDPTTAFTIGLFHSLDLVIQDYFFTDVLKARIEQYRIDNSLPDNLKIYNMIDSEYWWLSAVLLEHWQFPEPIVSVFRNTPETFIPKMKIVVLTSNMILRSLENSEKIPDAALAEAHQLFSESGLGAVDFQECVYDSEKLYTEMSGWMFG